MVQTTANTISATNGFSASVGVDTQIPRAGFIPEIAFNVEMNYSNSGAPTLYSDVFDRVITSLVIAGDGRQFVNISDMRLLAFMNLLDYGLNYRRPDPVVTTTNNLLAQIPYVLHFGQHPNDIFDPLGSPGAPACGIPADQLNTLVATVTWGATTAMAAATAVVQTATLARFLPHIITPGYDGGAGNRYYPKISTTVETFTAIWTNFGKTFNVPVGGIVKRALIMAVDGTAPSIRDDLRPTRIGLLTPKDGNAHRMEMTWTEFQNFSSRQYPAALNADTSSVSINQLTGLATQAGVSSTAGFGAKSQRVGLGVFDFRKIAMRRDGRTINPLGADMRGRAEGDLKIGIDWGTGSGQAFILWDALEEY